nr:hypothetical protein [Tanacetum cinerariifolium]
DVDEDSSEDSVKSPSALRFVELDNVLGFVCRGRPKPSAKAVGLPRPAIPKGTSSSVAINSARHSAGGKRWKKLRAWDVISGNVKWGEEKQVLKMKRGKGHPRM